MIVSHRFIKLKVVEIPFIKTQPATVPRGASSQLIAVFLSVALHGTGWMIAVAWTSNRRPQVSLRQGHAVIQLSATEPAVPQEAIAEVPLEVEAKAEPVETPLGQQPLARQTPVARRPTQHRQLIPLPEVAAPLAPPMKSQQTAADPLVRRRAIERPLVADHTARPPRRTPAADSSAQVLAPAVEIVGSAKWTPEPLPTNAPPVYPPAAIARRVQGTTLLSVTVTVEGTVSGVTVKRSSGSRLLDQAALKAVAAWRFKPRPRAFGSAEKTIRIPVQFELGR